MAELLNIIAQASSASRHCLHSSLIPNGTKKPTKLIWARLRRSRPRFVGLVSPDDCKSSVSCGGSIVLVDKITSSPGSLDNVSEWRCCGSFVLCLLATVSIDSIGWKVNFLDQEQWSPNLMHRSHGEVPLHYLNLALDVSLRLESGCKLAFFLLFLHFWQRFEALWELVMMNMHSHCSTFNLRV